MPLDVNDFDRLSVSKPHLKIGVNQIKVAKFLQENIEEAFTQKEIKEVVGIQYDAAVNSALHSLKSKDLARSKEIEGTLYWRGNGRILELDFSDKKGTIQTDTKDEDRN